MCRPPLGRSAECELMSDHSHAHDHASSHGHDDHGGIAKYIYVFLALCVLTGASFFTYSELLAVSRRSRRSAGPS